MNNPGKRSFKPSKAPNKQMFYPCKALFIQLIFVLIPRIIYFHETFSEVKLTE